MGFTNRLVSAASRALGAPPTAADLRGQVPPLEIEVERTRAALQEAEDGRAAALLDPDETAVDRADEAIRVARKKHDRAVALLADLVRRADQAERDEIEAARRKRYDQAVAARDELLARIERDYIKPARQIAAFIANAAKVDAAIRAANRDLPEAAVPLAPVEADRATEPVEERIVSEREVRLWTRPGSDEPLDDLNAGLVEAHSDGHGVLRSGDRVFPVELRRFRRVEVIEPQARQWPDALASSVSLPGWRAGDAPAWSPARSADPDAIIAHAERLTGLAKVDPSPPRTTVRFEPL